MKKVAYCSLQPCGAERQHTASDQGVGGLLPQTNTEVKIAE